MLVWRSTETIVDRIVREYFKCVRGIGVDLSCSEITELFRHSLCVILGLDSMPSSVKIGSLTSTVVRALSGVVMSVRIADKAALLEACVTCMDMSRRYVECD